MQQPLARARLNEKNRVETGGRGEVRATDSVRIPGVDFSRRFPGESPRRMSSIACAEICSTKRYCLIKRNRQLSFSGKSYFRLIKFLRYLR